jgi:hypothetical protein
MTQKSERNSQTRLRSTQKWKASLEANYIGKRRTTHAGNEHHSRLTTESLIQQAKAAEFHWGFVY